MTTEGRNGITCVVVMGPSGVGKTTTAEGLAARLGWAFAEADRFHPQANIDKMTAGIPLDDDDRAPWLALIRDWISAKAQAGESTVVTCSALKRRYRDVLRGADARVRFLELMGEVDTIQGRMASRKGHYMPPSLLASQFADLEPLDDDEDGVIVDVSATPEEVISAGVAKLGLARS
ncbi:gluconokinase [Methylopila capsulata]|uniref:Gluconokinase n=1 Tax=Methylopila capsulata TaxID=61654 RepID=A0A9W6IR45_9HYPH|nr:gluconokinase [Methylopila capsulata]MBM7851085.1 gluconokinase [Methylopila capsulata]GLK54142.1 gluconokinase [Methylopila capsulata]